MVAVMFLVIKIFINSLLKMNYSSEYFVAKGETTRKWRH